MFEDLRNGLIQWKALLTAGLFYITQKCQTRSTCGSGDNHRQKLSLKDILSGF